MINQKIKILPNHYIYIINIKNIKLLYYEKLKTEYKYNINKKTIYYWQRFSSIFWCKKDKIRQKSI